MPRRKAENHYEDAVSSGDSAILIEEPSPGLYCVSLGNLAPIEAAELTFEFGQMLEWTLDCIRLRIPTAIAPRYGKPDMRLHAVPAASIDVIRHAELRIVVKGGTVPWRFASPTHSLLAAVDERGMLTIPRVAAGS